MHPYLITKLAETVVADRLAEAERRTHARRGGARPRKVGRIASVGRFVGRLASSQNDAAPIVSRAAGCSPCR